MQQPKTRINSSFEFPRPSAHTRRVESFGKEICSRFTWLRVRRADFLRSQIALSLSLPSSRSGARSRCIKAAELSERHLPPRRFLRRHSYVRERQCDQPPCYGGGMSGPLFRATCTACQPTYDFIRALHHSIMLAGSVFTHRGARQTSSSCDGSRAFRLVNARLGNIRCWEQERRGARRSISSFCVIDFKAERHEGQHGVVIRKTTYAISELG